MKRVYPFDESNFSKKKMPLYRTIDIMSDEEIKSTNFTSHELVRIIADGGSTENILRIVRAHPHLINQFNDQERTPLMSALHTKKMYGNQSLIEGLLKNNANPNLKSTTKFKMLLTPNELIDKILNSSSDDLHKKYQWYKTMFDKYQTTVEIDDSPFPTSQVPISMTTKQEVGSWDLIEQILSAEIPAFFDMHDAYPSQLLSSLKTDVCVATQTASQKELSESAVAPLLNHFDAYDNVERSEDTEFFASRLSRIGGPLQTMHSPTFTPLSSYEKSVTKSHSKDSEDLSQSTNSTIPDCSKVEPVKHAIKR